MVLTNRDGNDNHCTIHVLIACVVAMFQGDWKGGAHFSKDRNVLLLWGVSMSYCGCDPLYKVSGVQISNKEPQIGQRCAADNKLAIFYDMLTLSYPRIQLRHAGFSWSCCCLYLLAIPGWRILKIPTQDIWEAIRKPREVIAMLSLKSWGPLVVYLHCFSLLLSVAVLCPGFFIEGAVFKLLLLLICIPVNDVTTVFIYSPLGHLALFEALLQHLPRPFTTVPQHPLPAV